MTTRTKTPEEKLLEDAYAAYLQSLAVLHSIEQCRSWAPDGTTRCQLLQGHVCKTPEAHPTVASHDADCGGLHRHKPRGFTVGVITWEAGL